MLGDFFATKLKMTQVWTQDGKRIPVTIVKASDLKVVGQQKFVSAAKNAPTDITIVEIGMGDKKLANVPKSLRARLEKQGFSTGVTQVTGVRVKSEEVEQLQPGKTIAVNEVLTVGDLVQIQGTSRGMGFTGAVKRYGFKGGPKTHGQSDRTRAVGAIGNRTTPGRVFLGKRMPGHSGDATVTVSGVVVLHIDTTNQEVWLSGPVPGSSRSLLRIRKTGDTKVINVDKKASGIKEVVVEPTAAENAEVTETEQA